MRSLGVVERWPGRHAAVVVTSTADGAAVIASTGPIDESFAYASVTKLASSLAVLVEVGEGRCDLDDAVGPPGATLAHLLSHASGLSLEGTTPVAAPGTRRVYSNVGVDIAVEHAARRASTTPTRLVADRVLEPLGMTRTALAGRSASGMVGPTDELGVLGAELLSPTLLSGELAARMRTVQYPGLVGVLPGFGPHDPCDWALGAEVKGTKHPHWTGTTWPASTVGHFGQSGGFLAVDDHAGLVVATLGDAPFGPWATTSWPAFTDAVRAEQRDHEHGASR